MTDLTCNTCGEQGYILIDDEYLGDYMATCPDCSHKAQDADMVAQEGYSTFTALQVAMGWDDMQAREELYASYSDVYKGLNGFRPRAWKHLASLSLTELATVVSDLIHEAREEATSLADEIYFNGYPETRHIPEGETEEERAYVAAQKALLEELIVMTPYELMAYNKGAEV